MIIYEDLPEDIKTLYSKEQCEQLIVAAEKLSQWVTDFMEALRKIVQAIQPTLKELDKRLDRVKKLFEEAEVSTPLPQPNHKYLPYKPKLKQMIMYKKTIYYHIRSNC